MGLIHKLVEENDISQKIFHYMYLNEVVIAKIKCELGINLHKYEQFFRLQTEDNQSKGEY